MPSNLLEVFTNCYGRYGVRAAIDLAPQAGITHLELAMKQHGGVLEIPEDVVASEKLGDAGIQKLKEELDSNGLTVISANGSDNLMDPDGFARIAERMRLAAAIGAKYFVGLGGEPAEEDRSDFFDKMGAIGDVAASHGLTIALETHPGITQNANAILETMQALQHDAIRINFDTGNILFYNEGADVYEQLEQVMDYVVHMHLKDSRAATGTGTSRQWATAARLTLPASARLPTMRDSLARTVWKSRALETSRNQRWSSAKNASSAAWHICVPLDSSPTETSSYLRLLTETQAPLLRVAT